MRGRDVGTTVTVGCWRCLLKHRDSSSTLQSVLLLLESSGTRAQDCVCGTASRVDQPSPQQYGVDVGLQRDCVLSINTLVSEIEIRMYCQQESACPCMSVE